MHDSFSMPNPVVVGTLCGLVAALALSALLWRLSRARIGRRRRPRTVDTLEDLAPGLTRVRALGPFDIYAARRPTRTHANGLHSDDEVS